MLHGCFMAATVILIRETSLIQGHNRCLTLLACMRDLPESVLDVGLISVLVVTSVRVIVK